MFLRLLFILGVSQYLVCHAWYKDRCFDEMLPEFRCYNLRPPYINSNFHYPQSPTEQDIQFQLFTNNNNNEAQILGAQDVSSVTSSDFDANGKVVFLVHGWTASQSNPVNQDMRKELLQKVPNVIAVDWSKGAKGPNYFQAVANTRVVGAQIATMIKTLQQVGLKLADVHLVGHSLGAHTVGYAGEKFTTTQIGRITGLDPAGPLFEGFDNAVKLDAGDAAFVDIIHTDAKPFIEGGLGTSEICGDADFFPNGGHDMTGCSENRIDISNPTDVSLGVVCSHAMAVLYFNASINVNNYEAYPCASLDDYENGLCTSCGSGCSNMGYHADPSKTGMFVLDTKADWPY